MTNKIHIEILKTSVGYWNEWKDDNSEIIVDLSAANLSESDFSKANLSRANLSETNLSGTNLNKANLFRANLSETDLREAYLSEADLREAYLRKADLRGADLSGVDLREAYLKGADLRGTNLSGANLKGADLSGADLREADLTNSNLVDTKLLETDLSGCHIYGISVWNIETDENTKQNNLVITKENESIITVDNLEVAEFIYLMLNNQMVKEVIHTITSNVVLILGMFASERKRLLDALREELRNHNFTPILFDYNKPNDRTFIETVSTLAHMSRFVIADFTDPKLVLQEAQHIIPNIAIPFAPIFLNGSGFEPVALDDLRKGRTTVLDTFCYNDTEHLLENINQMIITPAEVLAGKLDRKFG